jgi:hypothetical protein
MTNLLGVPDPVPTPVTPIADGPIPPVQPVEPSVTGQDAQPVKVTSAVGGAPPLPAPMQEQMPSEAKAKALSGVESVPPVPSPIVEGGAISVGGGQPLGQPVGPVQSAPVEPTPVYVSPPSPSSRLTTQTSRPESRFTRRARRSRRPNDAPTTSRPSSGRCSTHPHPCPGGSAVHIAFRCCRERRKGHGRKRQGTSG